MRFPAPALSPLLAVLVVFGSAACGDSSSDAGYGDATLGVFMSACDPASEGGDRRTVCACAYDQLQKKFTYEQFSSIDGELKADPKRLPAEVLHIISGCSVAVGLGPSAPSSDSQTSDSSDSRDSRGSDG